MPNPLPILIIQLCDAERGDLFDAELQARGIPYQRLKLHQSDSLPSYQELRAAIILGSPTSVNEYQQQNWARELYGWTATALRMNLPLLGICYGSQLLAKLLGATVSRHTQMELGVYDARLTESGAADPLFANFPETFPVAHWHGETWKLPFGATLLCEGDECRNQTFRRGNVVGVQFHLEGSASELASWPRVYPEDVAISGIDAEKLAEGFRTKSAELHRLFRTFLDNWLKEI